MNESLFLEGRDLWKEYSSGVVALAGVTLEIFQGEVLVIVGPSGAGKSTLLHLLGGLDRPTKGEVILKESGGWRVEGGRWENGDKKREISLYRISESERALIRNRQIGFVFQFYHLLPEFSALENVLLSGLVAGMPQAGARKRAEELLRKVGLAERKYHKPSHLSGGEQQRVALARALMNHPKVLLCDEPTGNLDSKTGAMIIELLWQLTQSEQQTVVIVTHDAEVASRANRMVYMKDGRIKDGKIEEIQTR